MIGIFNLKKKANTNPVSTRLSARLLRFFRLDDNLTTSVASLVGEAQGNVSEDYRREIRDATLQAEYMKAQATMMMQNRRSY